MSNLSDEKLDKMLKAYARGIRITYSLPLAELDRKRVKHRP